LPDFKRTPEGNDAIKVYERERDITERIFAMNATAGCLFVRLMMSVPGEFGVDVRHRLEAADDKEKYSDGIPNLFRVADILGFEQG
jgi:hypothetical protein